MPEPLFKNGDILVSTVNANAMYQYDGTTHALIRTFTGAGDYTGAWLSPLGHLWVICWGGRLIQCWDMQGNVLWSKSLADSASEGKPETVAFDRVGNAYVGTVYDVGFGAGGGGILLKYRLDGTHVGTYSPTREDRGVDHIEFHSDGQTLYYTSEGRKVMRWNTASNAQAAEFTTFTGGVGTKFYAIRRVPADGSWVVANSPGGLGGPAGEAVYRFNASGGYMRSYGVPGVGAFGMDIETDGLHFWVAVQLPSGSSGVHKVNLANGAIVATISTASSYVSNVVNVIKTISPLLKIS